MRKILSAILVVMFTFSVMTPSTARAEVPVKAKAFMTIVGYGTAGGALLGAASMAFGTSSRAIAQGASLGLYAGILFGSYVLISHHQRRYGNYDDNASPYQESSDIYTDEYQNDDGGSQDQGGDSSSGFFNRYQVIQQKFGGKTKGLPPIQLNLLQYNF